MNNENLRQGRVWGDEELAFSNKYDEEMAVRYFEKHQQGIWRRFKTWHEAGMLRKALRLAGEPKSILGLPCGTGRFWNVLAEEAGRKIFAADLNSPMFQVGLRRRPATLTSRIEVFQASAFAIPRPDNFVECVFCIRLMHHIAEREDRLRILRELKRVSSSKIIVSLWIDGNLRARRQQRRPVRPGRRTDCYVIPRQVIEQEFAECGLTVVGRVDLLKYYSMWTTYVLRK